MKVHDAFISYSRDDLCWIEEELMPALADLQAVVFIDDGARRGLFERAKIAGLQIGQELEAGLAKAIGDSRAVLVILSPAYFSSEWCRWEYECVHRLAASGECRVFCLILQKWRGRLDPAPRGLVYCDISCVHERAGLLMVPLSQLKPPAVPRPIKLGAASLQHLLADEGTLAMLAEFKQRHQEYRRAHARMNALKAVHDAIQAAQDAWRALSDARDLLRTCQVPVGIPTVNDLVAKIDQITSTLDAPELEAETFSWDVHLRTCRAGVMRELGAVIANPKNLDALNLMLEASVTFLTHSRAATSLSGQIREVSRKIPIQALRETLAPLRRLGALSWQEQPLAGLAGLMRAFDEAEGLLEMIAGLVEVHHGLQHIDELFNFLSHTAVRLVDVESNWPAIEDQRAHLTWQAETPAPEWLGNLDLAAQMIVDYLQQVPRPDAPPENQIEFFGSRLNSTFNQADSDLLQATTKLGAEHDSIDRLVGRLAQSAGG